MATQDFIKDLLSKADLELNGSNPWDIQVKNTDLYKRVLQQGSLGFGESYMYGWWDADRLDETMHRILRAELQEKIKTPKALISILIAILINKANPRRSFEVGKTHYDKGNDLYKAMLDKRLTYTCGYWKDVDNLDDAQEAKLDLVCKKIGLNQGDRVLDIGCGWGSFLKYAAEKYEAKGLGVTISQEQANLARENLGDYNIEIRVQDYRELDESKKFDHIVSLGMFEHVGYKNYDDYFKVAERNLKDDGLFLLHTIGNNKTVRTTDPWIEKYIFPNSMLPSLKQITDSVEGVFEIEDVHNFGPYYDKTLMAWYNNFAQAWDGLKHTYDERFYRMWRFYLLSCAGLFRARKAHLWQIVLSKNGVKGGYESIR